MAQVTAFRDQIQVEHSHVVPVDVPGKHLQLEMREFIPILSIVLVESFDGLIRVSFGPGFNEIVQSFGSEILHISLLHNSADMVGDLVVASFASQLFQE